MKIIDVCGKPCPIPVIEAKKALAEEDGIVIIVDNMTAVQNLEKMARGYGYGFSYTEPEKNRFEATISKDGKSAPVVNADSQDDVAQCGPVGGKGLVVAIGRNTMGEGSEDLGKILLKGFIYSLSELPSPPECLIFFNSGAYLTTEGANTLESLAILEEKGTEILTCGTCIDYYGLTGKLAIGSVTNMYKITEKLTGAASVINI